MSFIKYPSIEKKFKATQVKCGENTNCIMPEMPYCPSCKYGRIEYPEWVETYEDTYDSGCEWICTLRKENAII